MKLLRNILLLVLLSVSLIALAQTEQQDKILIGSSSALTGHAQFLGTEYIKGARAYINRINEQGGIAGRKIELIALDDGYDPARCAENTMKFIMDEKVYALFNYVGTPTTLYILPLLAYHKVPLLGIFSGALALREPFNPYVINVRASYSHEISEFVRHGAEDLELKKIAVFYQYDAYGMDGLKATENALSKYNLKLVAEASYKRGTVDVSDAVLAIKNSQAEAVVMVGTYSPTAKFIKLCRRNNYKPLFYSVSFVGIEALQKELDLDAYDVIVSAVVPSLQTDKFPAAGEFKELLVKSFPDSQPTLGSFEGFINAKVLVEALKRCTSLDREDFIKAVETIKDFDVGIGVNITFGADDHQGLDQVYFNILSGSKLISLDDWKAVTAMLKKE